MRQTSNQDLVLDFINVIKNNMFIQSINDEDNKPLEQSVYIGGEENLYASIRYFGHHPSPLGNVMYMEPNIQINFYIKDVADKTIWTDRSDMFEGIVVHLGAIGKALNMFEIIDRSKDILNGWASFNIDHEVGVVSIEYNPSFDKITLCEISENGEYNILHISKEKFIEVLDDISMLLGVRLAIPENEFVPAF